MDRIPIEFDDFFVKAEKMDCNGDGSPSFPLREAFHSSKPSEDIATSPPMAEATVRSLLCRETPFLRYFFNPRHNTETETYRLPEFHYHDTARLARRMTRERATNIEKGLLREGKRPRWKTVGDRLDRGSWISRPARRVGCRRRVAGVRYSGPRIVTRRTIKGPEYRNGPMPPRCHSPNREVISSAFLGRTQP